MKCRMRCFNRGKLFPVTVCLLLSGLFARAHVVGEACVSDDPHAGPGYESADYFETLPDGSLPVAEDSGRVSAQAVGPVAPAVGQPSGVLSDRIIFMSGGHGWTASGSSWSLQRGVLLEMNEDYGNVDQMNCFAAYCFNAGATIVPMRPLGYQTNEVVLDNDDPGVSFAGTWSDSSSTVFYGSPGDLAYRFASLAATETATATYVPNLPAAGFYPVYTWVRHGTDRTSQLYRIRHTGGESLVRVPHHMVGNGWVYLGTYYFNSGSDSASGAVVISNLRSVAQGAVIIADAIRFGNGMGTFDRGFGRSTYPSEEECSRYWVQRGLGQGQSPTLYDPDLPNPTTDDSDDNVGTPPRMAREMNATGVEASIYKRLLISFHSNAAGGRGVLGLWNDNSLFPNTGTPNQLRLAQLLGLEINNDLTGIGVPPLELAWYDRGSSVTFRRTDFAFGEIRNDTLGGEMDATIVEVAFHDDDSDARLMRDPKVRNWVARATYQGVVRYMNEFDGAPLVFLPEPPGNVRALASGSNIVVSWSPPVAQGGSSAATGYVLYQSTNGYGFGNPIAVGNTLSFSVTNLAANRDYFFRVAATNSGGQSSPSETVASRFGSAPANGKVLIVNAFDRFDRFINIRQTPSSENYKPPGHDANGGAMDRMLPDRNNAFSYVVPHATALGVAGRSYDSCQNEAVAAGTVPLGNYAIVIWACGNESVNDETFSALEQSRITTYRAAGGNLFVSGADIAWDLDRASGPTAGDRAFLNDQLHADLGSDANANAGSYNVTSAAGGIFVGRANATFDDGSKGNYPVRSPDRLTPVGSGAAAALNYVGGLGGAAAVQYDGSAGGGRTVLLGFPFETITDAARRNQYMGDVLNFLSVPPVTNAPPTILAQPQSQFVVQHSNATLTVTAAGTAPLSYQWRFNGEDLAGATQPTLARVNCQPANSGFYDVTVSNAFGMTTSAVALLEVALPPLFWDNFDANTVASWAMNRSSTDCRVTFNYNHAGDGIPSAPNSAGGTTRAVKFEANVSQGIAAAINISPTGRSFTGDYRLRFDLWMNQNGPFPAGGNGSTQHGTAGIGTTGNRVQWTGSGSMADGHWFAVDGEGQASDTSITALNDWGAFSGTTYHAAASGVYAAGAASNARGNGHPYYAATFPGGQTAPAAQQSSYPQQSGALSVGTIGFAWRDVLISKTGSSVEWFIDGLKIATINGASFAADNIFVGLWDSFNSLSDNTNLSFALFDNVRVEGLVTNVPAYLTRQPADLNLKTGTNATFTVVAGGTGPLNYQWRFNGTNLAGATQSSYTRMNLTTNDAGSYSVVVTNVFGSVTSAVAQLVVSEPVAFRTTIVMVQDGDQLKLVLTGEPGSNVIIWRSEDFTNWIVLTNLPNTSGTVEFVDPVSPATPQRFYRVEFVP